MHHLSGSASELNARPWPEDPVPSACFLSVDGPALVLGSTQSLAEADKDRAVTEGFAVVHRRSGGGAVLLRPGALVWVDVTVPATDERWTADVGPAFLWLGETWTEALAALGMEGARWHDGPLVRSAWSDRVCFAGLGPGEVTVGGRKVVGMSQRRKREAALFQCAALLAWDAGEISRLLGLGPGAERELAGVATGLPVDAASLEGAFVEALARR